MTTSNIAVVAVTDFFALYYPLVETSRAVSSIAAPRVTITDAKDDAVRARAHAQARAQAWTHVDAGADAGAAAGGDTNAASEAGNEAAAT